MEKTRNYSARFYWLNDEYESIAFSTNKNKKYPAFDLANIPSKKLDKIYDEDTFCTIFSVDKFSN